MMVTAMMTLPAASNLNGAHRCIGKICCLSAGFIGDDFIGARATAARILVVQPAREVIKNTKIKGRSRHI